MGKWMPRGGRWMPLPRHVPLIDAMAAVEDRKWDIPRWADAAGRHHVPLSVGMATLEDRKWDMLRRVGAGRGGGGGSAAAQRVASSRSSRMWR